MNDHFIVTRFIIIDKICNQFLAPPKYNPKMVPSEIVLVAIVAARYFNNNLEQTLTTNFSKTALVA